MKRYSAILLLMHFGCATKINYPEGGYKYPLSLTTSDTSLYFYPIKDIESKKEAFQDAFAYLFYQPFNEPNLSIRSQPTETFRLTYSTAFGNSIIITLTDSRIIVKKGIPATLYGEDTSTLTRVEKFHLRLLRAKYPIDAEARKSLHRHYYDSLVDLYPELLDVNYYHKIYKKTIVYTGEKFTYPEDEIHLTKHQYRSLVRELNTSDFWTLPYKIDCPETPMDGDSFIFEANTRSKYQVVYIIGCPDDTTRFTKACQKLINLAGMQKEIDLIWSGLIDTATPGLQEIQ